MGSPRIARSGLRSPRGWLFLAFLGVWLYLASQLLRLYPARVADVVVLPVSEVREILALSAGLGQLLFFGGLVAALWRANLAAGVSNAGIRGLAFGVAGVGLLGVFEFALFLDWLGAAFNPMALFAQTPVMDTGVIAGTALAFAGLASLVVGFAQSTDLFGRRQRRAPQRTAQREETGCATRPSVRGRMSSEVVDLTLELPPSPEDRFLASFLAELRERIPASKDELQQLKRRIARSHGVAGIPSDSDVLGRLPLPIRDELVDLLRIKPARTASGVAVVTVMTAPHACPHGVCTFCPGGPRFGTPQSYVGTEPAARRASAHGYDPGAQLVARLRSLEEIGHPTDKVDLIVLGGTFTALDRGYQEWFVKGCLDAMNGFVSDSISAAQAANETAAARCIGLTIETKPDCLLGSEVDA